MTATYFHDEPQGAEPAREIAAPDIVARLRSRAWAYSRRPNTATDLAEAADEIERLRDELAAAQDRGLAELRRYENLWRLAYKVGPVMLDVRGGHGIYRAVTVNGVSYNIDDPDDLARLEAVDA